jgi:putative DNA primase/helicase
MNGYLEQFIDAIRAAGITPPEVIEADERIHRFDARDKGDKAGWYVLHGDDIPVGTFGDWRTGLKETWQADIGRSLTQQEKADLRAKREAQEGQREAEEKRIQAEAAKRAADIWSKSKPAPADHLYLTNKGVKPYGLRVYNGRLVVPVRDGPALCSLQFIGPDSEKRFLAGGRKKGCYFSFGGNPDKAGVLCIAEGYATAASVHEATGYPLAVAFDAGNLKPVAETLRGKFPGARIILCADDDNRTEDNPGLTKATEAARAASGLLAVPSFGDDRPEKATDFNDLHQLKGLAAVRECIVSAQIPPIHEPIPTQENTPQNETAAIITRLAALSSIEYARTRKAEAKALGINVSVLDAEVKRARGEKEEGNITFDEVEPWPEPVELAALLSDISRTVHRFIVCQEETANAVALWIAFTWYIDVVQVAPLALITAPEMRCGKSQLLSLMGRLVAKPLLASNISPSALFRVVEACSPTLLIDEADAFLRDNEELRGIINCGHTRDGAYIIRSVGENFTPTRFSVWGAKAVAGIGNQANTIMDRSITLVLRRKLPNETIDRLRHAEPDLFPELKAKLARCADDYRETVRQARPDLPEQLNDRAQDNWEPLMAVALVAGGSWPEKAKAASLILSGADSPLHSIGTELLADIQELFESKNVERISTAELIHALCSDEEKTWATYNRGRQISPRQVSARLKEYGIVSKTIRVGVETPKGYTREQFKEAFSRYLSPPSESATVTQPYSEAEKPVADNPPRCGNETQNATLKPALVAGCGIVADKKGGWEATI